MYREAYGKPQIPALKPSGFRTETEYRILGNTFLFLYSLLLLIHFFAIPSYIIFIIFGKKKLQAIFYLQLNFKCLRLFT